MEKPTVGHNVVLVKKERELMCGCLVDGEVDRLDSNLSSTMPQFGDFGQVYSTFGSAPHL